MGQDEDIPEHLKRLRARQRRPTVRAAAVHRQETVRPPERGDATEPTLDLERTSRTTMKVRSFRARAQSDYAKEARLPRDLNHLLEEVLSGKRDIELAEALGTDELGLRDLERRFLLRAGRSVYVAAVEVVNRAARMRRDEFER